MSNTGRAIVAHDTLPNNGWKIEEVTVRAPSEGELLVDMVSSGICHSDLVVGSVPAGAAPTVFYPRVLGHEGAGYVREVGPGVTVAQPGDPVLLSFNYCRTCSFCKNDQSASCEGFQMLNMGPFPEIFTLSSPPAGTSDTGVSGCFFGQSSFASVSVVKDSSVTNVKSFNLSKEDLKLFAPLGCAVQTGAGSVFSVAKATPKDTICIMGLGGVGLSAVMGAKLVGCERIIIVDRVSSRLQLAKELGATHTVDGSQLPEGTTLADAIKATTESSRGPSIVLDATGVPAVIEAGYEATSKREKYLQIGAAPPDYKLSVPMLGMVTADKQIIGAIEGWQEPNEFLPKLVKWYKEGKLPLAKIVQMLPAEEFGKALQGMHGGEIVKPVLVW